MRILLDENMSHSVLGYLREEGHASDSVNSLRLKGIDNGKLYREVAQGNDLFFTRDLGFIEAVRKMKTESRCITLYVRLPQLPKDQFLPLFKDHFQSTNWSKYHNGENWP